MPKPTKRVKTKKKSIPKSRSSIVVKISFEPTPDAEERLNKVARILLSSGGTSTQPKRLAASTILTVN